MLRLKGLPEQRYFAHDESLETMGKSLKLPEQYEGRREQLEERLIPIEVRNITK